MLTDLGVGTGDRVMTLLGRTTDQYVAALGTLKRGAVFSPLFSSFGPEPIRDRLQLEPREVLVTTPDLYRARSRRCATELTELEHVLLTERRSRSPGTIDLDGCAGRGASPDFDIPHTDPEDMALLHFTSGTTGKPKGAVHVHEAVVAHHATSAFALDLHAGDVFWCTADPGWVTGTSYGIIAPLTHGATLISYAGEFDARAWYRVLQEQRVQVWYTAPTALRMLMKYGAEVAHEFDLSSLRHIASVGEALNPEVVVWGRKAFGLTIHDNWWQTETGAIMISNYPGMEVRPGSMGRPMPGVEAAVLVRGEDGRAAVSDDDRSRVAPAARPARSRCARAGRRCSAATSTRRSATTPPSRAAGTSSGDLAKVDDDGYFWFVGRADDVIKSAGHLIGPFEVETALMEHPAVVEAGVIGKPDPVAGEIVKAFVTLRPATSRPRSCAWSCSRSAAAASAGWRPRRSTSTSTCRTPAAAR